MDLMAAYYFLGEVAKCEGLTIEDLTLQINQHIAESINSAKSLDDAAALTKWDAITHLGDIPNAAELLAYLARIVWQTLGDTQNT